MKEWMQDDEKLSNSKNDNDKIRVSYCSSLKSKKSKAVCNPNVLMYMNKLKKSVSAQLSQFDQSRDIKEQNENLKKRLSASKSPVQVH